MATTDRCIDNSPHTFVFVRQESEEVTRHYWETYDVYFCQKCLKYEKVEVPKKERRGW